MMKPQLAIIGLLAVALASCGGGGSSNPISTANQGYFRFVNGSADAGAVDIFVDGNKINTTSVAYGQMTAYNKFSVGSHAIVVNRAGTSTAITLPSSALSQGLNNGQYVSLVLSGEMHPVTSSNTLNLLAFNDNPFSTPSGGAAVNVHNAATGYTSPVQFGYYYINTPSSSFPVSTSATAAGSLTQPFGFPSSALSASIQVGFYANSDTNIVSKPSDFSSSCAANTLPCDAGNFSLYFIDGPAASTSPSAGPYPDEITSTSMAGFVGIVDANGT